MELLNIYTFPDPILRKKALPVTDFDQSLDDTVRSMLETMYFSGGIGLAAIQAGILKQIIVIDLKSGDFKLAPDNEEHKKYPQIGKCFKKSEKR